ncbi:type I pantothenate kinase [Helcobacillus massiliensis]|uniref:type I pantothenate kinase n=1 Tax=Helcobacillus massiliensis TaxID=521392 RepID=UPI0037C06E45
MVAVTVHDHASPSLSPFTEIARDDWASLSGETPLPLTADEIETLRGLGDRLDMDEVNKVYRPISRLLNLQVQNAQSMRDVRNEFLHQNARRTPYIIGVAGSVAVGKSTTARLLRELTARWPETPRVQLVTTDGFLYPTAELKRRDIMHRKGFPESYDRRALLRFVADVKSGQGEVLAPVYSHISYDILPDEFVRVQRPDVLIVEGLNVLQAPRVRADGRVGIAVSDYFDFSVYVDAREDDIRRWYIERFLSLRATAFAKEDSYFRRYADLGDDEARATAAHIWDTINGPNLRENVQPSRGRADLILRKSSDHEVRSVLLRRI